MEYLTIIGIGLLIAGVFIFLQKPKNYKLMTFGAILIGVLLIAPSININIGGSSFSIGGDGADISESTKGTTSGQLISTFLFTVKDRFSNEYDTVDGTLEIYTKGVDPKDANTKPIHSITITDGNGSLSNRVTTGTYHIIFDGGTTYETKDYGDVVLSDDKYNSDLGTYALPDHDLGVMKLATLGNIFDEATGNRSFNGGNYTWDAEGYYEIYTAGGSTDTIVYNETSGDGIFNFEIELAVEGADAGVENLGLCFPKALTNGAEVNDVSQLTIQRQKGHDFGISTDLTDEWANDQCVLLDNGDVIEGGTSGTYKVTIQVIEANLDTNDDWYMILDYVGDGDTKKNDALNLGSNNIITKQTLSFDAVV